MTPDGEDTPIAVLGAGAWGTALSMVMARHGRTVRLWSHRPQHAEAMARAGRNDEYLPHAELPSGITPTASLGTAIDAASAVIIAVPSRAFEAVLGWLGERLTPGVPVVWATKGLGSDGLLGASVVRDLPAHPRGVLSGPSFAAEVAAGLPTAVTLAVEDSVTGEILTNALQGQRFRIYPSQDLVGVQLAGAVKNVIAIGTGIADGMQLGANARAGLMTRGLAEMRRLGHAMGADDETFSGLAGMGDLVLTCSDDQSRNRRYGLALGRSDAAESAVRTVEGAGTADPVLAMAARYGVELPISEQVAAVVTGRITPQEAVDTLMERRTRR